MSGCLSGAMIAPATSLNWVVTAAIADSRTSELGHGVEGSWLPGRAYSLGLTMTPLAPALRPSTMCSLIITASNPASSASRAHLTSLGRSRPVVIVQFSLRMRTNRGAKSLPVTERSLWRSIPHARRAGLRAGALQCPQHATQLFECAFGACCLVEGKLLKDQAVEGGENKVSKRWIVA